MKQLFIVLFLGAALYLQSQKLYHLPKGITSNDYLSKTIILKVKPAFKSNCSITNINHPALQTLSTNLGITHLNKKFPSDKSPEREFNQAGQRYADLSLIYELKYTSNIDIEKAISKLLATGIFIYAEPHFIPKSTYSPNDPLATAGNQYHLQTINAFGAWDINKGDSSIVIGITDTGIDFSHPDLFNNVKRNYNDIPDGIDNDGDLFIDNYMGWDMGMNDSDPTFQANSHGVHVSGIAGASTDNTIGGAGIGFNCKILPVKISDAIGDLVAAYEGIKYAADHGCTVVNCSWGSPGSSQYGQDIIDYATINKNCLVVAAAGNNIFNTDFYPAAYNYVLAVSNTNSTDVRSNSSNFGYFVDVCAPGENVFSTWPGNMYINQSGTSMASPVVAGAAGIVKKQFPTYNALQIGERLKVTADNIYPLNAPYINRLGSGRINLFRALTDPASPSIIFTDKIISDHNDEAFIVGDTLFISGNFINYLDPTSALTVSVTSLSSYASVIDNTTSLGVINTLATKNNNTDLFRFKLTGSIPINQLLEFEVLMQDGSYQAKQFFSVYVNVDYINIAINDVQTTATSNGKIGYNQNAQVQGLGFKYKGIDLLYEGGLMIGADTTRVSDCVRGSNPSITDFDFMNVVTIAKQIPSIVSDFDTKATINDNVAFSPLPVEVVQNTLAWSSNPNKQFVIWEYNIKNTHNTDTIKNMYAGIFADWDIDGGTFAQNRSAYDATTKMGYCYYTATGGKYAGIKLLTSNALPNFYAFDIVAGGNGGFDISNGYDTKEKYKTLSTQRLAAGVSGSGSDNANVMSTGPFQVLPNQVIKVAFAILGGDSLQNLITAANQAQLKYDGIPTIIQEQTTTDHVSVFPNPATDQLTILQNTFEFKTVEIYNINGQLILKKSMNLSRETIDLSDLSKGVFSLKLIGEEKQLVKKIVLVE